MKFNRETISTIENIGGGDIVGDSTYDLVKTDIGRTKSFTNGSAITLNIPAGIWSNNFQVGLIQHGAGAITPTAALGVTIVQRQSHTTTAGQGAFAALVADPAAEDSYIFTGDTA